MPCRSAAASSFSYFFASVCDCPVVVYAALVSFSPSPSPSAHNRKKITLCTRDPSTTSNHPWEGGADGQKNRMRKDRKSPRNIGRKIMDGGTDRCYTYRKRKKGIPLAATLSHWSLATGMYFFGAACKMCTRRRHHKSGLMLFSPHLPILFRLRRLEKRK